VLLPRHILRAQGLPLRDRQQHAAAGLFPSLAPGDVSYEIHRTERGYHVSARIQPGGLVFVPREGVQTLRARVDIIDAGAPGTREFLRSSHPTPRWGEPSTFHVVKLARPLALQLVAGVPGLSGREQPELRPLPPYFMRVGAEWRGVMADPTTPTDYANRFCEGMAHGVTEHVFLQLEDNGPKEAELLSWGPVRTPSRMETWRWPTWKVCAASRTAHRSGQPARGSSWGRNSE
jgi:hypothetical protein